MHIRQVMRALSIIIGLSVVVLSGCANFIKPETGAIARKDARIELTDKSVQEGIFKTKDLELPYSITEAGKTFNFTGKLYFAQSLTYSFGAIDRFTLKLNFLDDHGRVLETVDITPLYMSFGSVPDHLNVNLSYIKPAGTEAIAFNYYGELRGDVQETGGTSWEVYYFPFD